MDKASLLKQFSDTLQKLSEARDSDTNMLLGELESIIENLRDQKIDIEESYASMVR